MGVVVVGVVVVGVVVVGVVVVTSNATDDDNVADNSRSSGHISTSQRMRPMAPRSIWWSRNAMGRRRGLPAGTSRRTTGGGSGFAPRLVTNTLTIAARHGPPHEPSGKSSAPSTSGRFLIAASSSAVWGPSGSTSKRTLSGANPSTQSCTGVSLLHAPASNALHRPTTTTKARFMAKA